MNIYVSNLSFNIQSEDLKQQFSQYGEVSSVNIVMDKITNRSRGFAFVDMKNVSSAEQAICGLNGITLDDRTIKVSEARPREDRTTTKGNFY